MSNCQSCKFWVGQANVQDLRLHNAQGECRRHPPVGYPMQTPQGISTIAITSVTPKGHWCGEYTHGLVQN